jgi:imidazolonepropionase-like amidohydrolase
MPTFSIDELRRIVETARSSGRPVAAHASSAEGMRRAVEAGVERSSTATMAPGRYSL